MDREMSQPGKSGTAWEISIIRDCRSNRSHRVPSRFIPEWLGHAGLGAVGRVWSASRDQPGAMSRARQHARGGAPPTLYQHRLDRASVVRISNDGRRAIAHSGPVDRVLADATPVHFEEDLATNAALDAADFGYGMGDDSLAAEEQEPEADGISVRVKAKRYTNSVR